MKVLPLPSKRLGLRLAGMTSTVKCMAVPFPMGDIIKIVSNFSTLLSHKVRFFSRWRDFVCSYLREASFSLATTDVLALKCQRPSLLLDTDLVTVWFKKCLIDSIKISLSTNAANVTAKANQSSCLSQYWILIIQNTCTIRVKEV